MYVVASLLDPAASLQTQELWNWLQASCGLAGITMTPLPHFTWQVATGYNFDVLDATLRELARQTRPFMARSTGLGIFTGDSPVLYTPLVKHQAMLELHRLIWKRIEGAGTGLNAHYQPEHWMPHITLAYRDVTREKLSCALAELAFRPILLDVVVNHLAVLYDVNGEIGIKARYDFASAET